MLELRGRWLKIASRRATIAAVDADDDEADNIPAKLQFVKHNRPNTDQIDEETKAYTDLCTAQLRNLKPKLSEQFQRRNNLSKELQGSLKKLTSLAKVGDYVLQRL